MLIPDPSPDWPDTAGEARNPQGPPRPVDVGPGLLEYPELTTKEIR